MVRRQQPQPTSGPLVPLFAHGSNPSPALPIAMVGLLSLQGVSKLMHVKKKGSGILDSPDSGPAPANGGLRQLGIVAAVGSAPWHLGHWSPTRQQPQSPECSLSPPP